MADGLESSIADPEDSARELARAQKRESRFQLLLVMPIAIWLAILGVHHRWALYAMVQYSYTGILLVHIFTRHKFSIRSREVWRALFEFLPIHLGFLLFLFLGQWEWFHYHAAMPDWLTHEGRKGSLYEAAGFAAAFALLCVESIWLGKRMRGGRDAQISPGI